MGYYSDIKKFDGFDGLMLENIYSNVTYNITNYHDKRFTCKKCPKGCTNCTGK